MKKFLITGGAGFIGSHLAERLVADGGEVWVLDNLSTGSLSNLDAVRDSPRLHVEVDDVENEHMLVDLANRVDIIFHLAAAVGVKLIIESPVRTIETNIRGTENVLKAAAKAGGKKVVLASTSEVYGKGDGERFAEGDDLVFGPTTCPRWSYGCSKAIDEFLALAYHRSKNIPLVIARLFNTVGPRQVGTYGMVLPRFVGRALAGEPITVYGDGRQVRCFAHVKDVVEALIALAESEAAGGGIFNVGSDQPVTVLELAERVRAIVNPQAPIEHMPYQEAYGPGFEDIRIRIPDVSRLRETVGFSPDAGLDAIIRDVTDFMSGAGSGSAGP